MAEYGVEPWGDEDISAAQTVLREAGKDVRCPVAGEDIGVAAEAMGDYLLAWAGWLLGSCLCLGHHRGDRMKAAARRAFDRYKGTRFLP